MGLPGTSAADHLLPVSAARSPRPLSRLGIVAAALIAVTIVGAVTLTSALTAQQQRAGRLSDASASAERLIADLTQAETGQRGFLLTGEDRYLEPYRAALPRITEDLEALRQAVDPGGSLSGPLAELERIVPSKIEELERTIELRRVGDLPAALGIVETDRGKALMDSALRRVNELDELAAAARSASDAALARWLWAGTFLGLTGLIAGVLLGLRLWREGVHVQHALARSERSLRGALDAMPQMVWSTRADGAHDYYNRRWYEFTGTTPTHFEGGSWAERLHPDDRDQALRRWRDSVATGAGFEMEYRLRRADGVYTWSLGRALPARDAETGAIARWYGTCTGIDEVVRARAELREALDAKDILLQEVNHRVKNSLQLVSSLLALQAGKARSAELKAALRDARARLSVIAKLHQRLYEGGTHGSVDLVDFLRELCQESLAAVQREPRTEFLFKGPETKAGIARTSNVAIDQAVPIALIVSELLTNAIKYAFPDGGGELALFVGANDAGLEVVMMDDGVGLPPGFDPSASHGVGMRVVTALARQLRGEIRVEQPPAGVGAAFRLVLPGTPA